MAKAKGFSDMKLTSVLKEWMEQEEWKDEIELKDAGKGAHVDTAFGINDQRHRLVLDTDEEGEVFAVHLFSPFNVPPARMADMSRILNRLNCGLRFGRLCCWDDDDSNPVTYEHAIDVEGSKLAPKQIGHMVSAAVS